jgi:alkane 1-monooxygenase
MRLYKKLGFLLIYIIPVLVVWGYCMGSWWAFSGFVFAYGIVPVWDELVGRDSENVTEQTIEDLVNNPFFTYILVSLVWVQFSLISWAVYVLGNYPTSPIEYAGLLLSLMTTSAGGINIAHELGHRKETWCRFWSKFNLMTVCYMHFYIEHNRGHHVHVGTPQDPATSRKGQTFYAFWSQSVLGGWLSAWRLEARRMQSKGLPTFSLLHNEMLRFIALPLLFAGVMFLLGGWIGVGFFFLQSLFAFSSLEAVNYIEHYGIERKMLSNGKYERVNPLHSWNANHLISNLLLFQLQRHSDHHANASRPYQILRHFEESPQLPFGYPVMILMAVLPPLWFSVMDKRLERWKSQAELETQEQFV